MTFGLASVRQSLSKLNSALAAPLLQFFNLSIFQSFNLLHMVWDALCAEETATVVGDENVVFDADAAEVLVGFQKVEIEEVLAMPTCAPLIDEGGDEVDAWFVGHDETFLQATTATQAIRAELFQVWAYLIVETHVNLS